jgi:hypothetical protein
MSPSSAPPIQQTGLSPVHDSVFIEDKNSPYVNIVVTRRQQRRGEREGIYPVVSVARGSESGGDDL